MRGLSAPLTAPVAAMLFVLILSTNSDASWRRRNCHRCEVCNPMPICNPIPTDNPIPSWARSIDPRTVQHIDGFSCWCCENGTWIQTEIRNCPSNIVACVLGPGPPDTRCPGVIHNRSADPMLYAMVCDSRDHVLRFALPSEKIAGYYSLPLLGQPCSSVAK
jgi:hypothetical protein